MRKFLMGVEACCRDFPPVRKSFEWRENERFVRLECKENDAGRFLLCSMTDVEGKKHRVVFPEGRGLLKRWSLLAKKIKGLGLKSSEEIKPVKRLATDTKKEEAKEVKEGKNLSHKKFMSWGCRGAEVAGKDCSSVDDVVWVDAGDSVPREAVGILHYSLIGKWKTKPTSRPLTKELEAWARNDLEVKRECVNSLPK